MARTYAPGMFWYTLWTLNNDSNRYEFVDGFQTYGDAESYARCLSEPFIIVRES